MRPWPVLEVHCVRRMKFFYKNYHDSYRGRCLAVIRAGKIPGKTVINVKSAGVKPVSLEVEVV